MSFKVNIYGIENGKRYNPKKPDENIVAQVDAEYLKDKDGKYILDPKSGKPYVVPVGYSPYDTVERNRHSENPYADLYEYRTGAPNDLQRSFNGVSHGGFVPAFTPIASFDVGVACATARATSTECLAGGGYINYKNKKTNPHINTKGSFKNNPENVPNISKGYDWGSDKATEALLNDYKRSPQETLQRTLDQNGKALRWLSQKIAEIAAGEISERVGDTSATEHMDAESWSDFWNDIKEWFKDIPFTFDLDDASESEGDRERARNWHKNWNDAKRTSSPLVLDLDGDGIETVHQDKGIYFDHAADGFAEQTGWAGADDGLLVRDLNGDGRIDSGAELFGNHINYLIRIFANLALKKPLGVTQGAFCWRHGW